MTRYVALTRLWHSLERRHVEPGELVDLGHIDAEDVARLEAAQAVALEGATPLDALTLLTPEQRAALVRMGVWSPQKLVDADATRVAQALGDLDVAVVVGWQASARGFIEMKDGATITEELSDGTDHGRD